jgi:aquaporin Z
MENALSSQRTIQINSNAQSAPGTTSERPPSFLVALKSHWPEYLMEGAELGLFMISACAFVVLLEYPTSPVHQILPNPTLRRVLIGIAMGLTAISLIYSPIGKRSGAHFNPSVTLTFFRLGKIQPWDAFFYIIAQFAGGTAGVFIAVLLLGDPVTDSSVQYAVTVPGMSGVAIAFLAEAIISFILMSVVLRVANTKTLARFTGIFAGMLVATYISLEAPYSGMSMNPARTFASAFPANVWTALWIYFTAPPLGMLLAAELYLRQHGIHQVFCAKLHHHNDTRCIFRCRFGEMGAGG